MKKSTSPHPLWATRYRKPGTELRRINNRYYLYEYKTVYNPTSKKPKKISGKCLGTITEKDGFQESPRLLVSKMQQSKISTPISVREYGLAYFIVRKFSLYADRLRKYFPDHWQQLLSIAYCRFAFRSPLKNMPYRIEASFLYEMLETPVFNDKTASGVLNYIGGQTEAMQAYMRSFIGRDDYILIDGTSIISKSENIPMVQKGYNTRYNFDGQVNILYIYSSETRMPVFYRLLPGSIRDVKAFKNTLALSGIRKAVIVADKGFYSKANITLLKKEKLDYIIPLKRDNPQIDYSLLGDNTFKTKARFFTHENRIVWHLQQEGDDTLIHLFLDDDLRLREERDYLMRTRNNPETYSIEKYYTKANRFGTIALLSEKTFTDSEDVYETYKSRMCIETMFDGMKNVLEADHTYMQNEQTLEGWMFVNHLCLQWYQELYIELKDKKLLKKISVNDYVQLLTNVKKIRINGEWYLNEFTNATGKLIKKLGLDLYNT